MYNYLCVAMGGAVGAVSRYAISCLPCLAGSSHFKTMAVNILGCFVIGVIWAVSGAVPVPKLWYNAMVAGFLGGFTTYSSFSLETVRLMGEGRVGESVLYAMLTLAGCLAACAAGVYGTSYVLKLMQS